MLKHFTPKNLFILFVAIIALFVSGTQMGYVGAAGAILGAFAANLFWYWRDP